MIAIEDRLCLLAEGRNKEKTDARGCYVTCVTIHLIQIVNQGGVCLGNLINSFSPLHNSHCFSSISPYHRVTLFNSCHQVQLI